MAYAIVILFIVAYLIGTFPSAVMVAKSRGIDITTFGSGNPGASNIARALGTKFGVLVFALDAGKGVVAVILGFVIADRPEAYVCAAAALLGHMFPAQRRFKGGKGIATGGGVLLATHIITGLVSILVWLAVMKLTRKASVASIAVVPLVPILFVLEGTPLWEILTIVALGVLVEIRHVSNIKRLIAGKEHNVGQA
jgi:glycerol-3-phosphate acyltransferase PlsY